MPDFPVFDREEKNFAITTKFSSHGAPHLCLYIKNDKEAEAGVIRGHGFRDGRTYGSAVKMSEETVSILVTSGIVYAKVPESRMGGDYIAADLPKEYGELHEEICTVYLDALEEILESSEEADAEIMPGPEMGGLFQHMMESMGEVDYELKPVFMMWTVFEIAERQTELTRYFQEGWTIVETVIPAVGTPTVGFDTDAENMLGTGQPQRNLNPQFCMLLILGREKEVQEEENNE